MAEEAAESERERTLTQPVVDALWSSGLMHWCNPAEAGGQEPTFAEMIETWIELAWQDGSLGWIGIANMPSAAASAAYLSDDGFKEVFIAHDNQVTMGGQFFPNGLGEDDRGRLPADRRLEFRLRHRATPSTWRPASSRPSTARW